MKYTQRTRSPWQRLWVQMSLAFGAVLIVTTIGTGLLAHFLRPDIPIEQWTGGNIDRELLQEWRNRGLLATLAAGAITAVAFGVWMSRRLTKPLNELAEGTHAITARDLAYRVPVQGSQEIQALAHSFNEMAQELETAERLRRNLLSDVAHELRTPLTVLQGNLRAMLDDVYTLDKSEVARLYDQTRHLIGLVNDLHELAQAEAHQLPLNLTPIDLVELAQAAGELLGPLFEQEDVHLALETPSTPVLVHADEVRMMQVIQNLVSNALRHTPTGGTIHLRITQLDARHNSRLNAAAQPNATQPAILQPAMSQPPAPDQIGVAHTAIDHTAVDRTAAQDHASAAQAQIEVQDYGDGIDAEHLPYVFDRFYRTDRARARDHGGAGLGLAIVRAMVEAHGGAVSVTSGGQGQGATFRVILNAIEKPQDRSPN